MSVSETPADPVTVYVVDEIELSRAGLELILQAQGMEVVGSGSADAAVARIPALKPCVVVLSDLAVMEVIAAKLPDAEFLVITDGPGVLPALTAGADGVADISVSVENLVLAINTIAAGHTWIDAQAAVQMRTSLQSVPVSQGPLDVLTPVEQQVAALLAQGRTNRDIAEELFIAEKTAKNYVSKILRTLAVTNRTQAGLLVRDLTDGLPAQDGG